MGKQGKLYIRFIIAVAILAAALFAYTAAASAPVATPAIVNSMSEIRDFRASSEAKASETFRWYKRTLYQPQNQLVVVSL